MVSILKSTVLSVGLLAALAAAANAQSVSALPPDGNTTPSYGTVQTQNAHTGIAGSTQSFYPKPGGGGIWKEPSAQSVTGAYPSMNETGPKPH
jgi:opacity protein-like surface antigen